MKYGGLSKGMGVIAKSERGNRRKKDEWETFTTCPVSHRFNFMKHLGCFGSYAEQ